MSNKKTQAALRSCARKEFGSLVSTDFAPPRLRTQRAARRRPRSEGRMELACLLCRASFSAGCFSPCSCLHVCNLRVTQVLVRQVSSRKVSRLLPTSPPTVSQDTHLLSESVSKSMNFDSRGAVHSPRSGPDDRPTEVGAPMIRSRKEIY